MSGGQEIDDQKVELRSPDIHEIEEIFQEIESLKRLKNLTYPDLYPNLT